MSVYQQLPLDDQMMMADAYMRAEQPGVVAAGNNLSKAMDLLAANPELAARYMQGLPQGLGTDKTGYQEDFVLGRVPPPASIPPPRTPEEVQINPTIDPVPPAPVPSPPSPIPTPEAAPAAVIPETVTPPPDIIPVDEETLMADVPPIPELIMEQAGQVEMELAQLWAPSIGAGAAAAAAASPEVRQAINDGLRSGKSKQGIVEEILTGEYIPRGEGLPGVGRASSVYDAVPDIPMMDYQRKLTMDPYMDLLGSPAPRITDQSLHMPEKTPMEPPTARGKRSTLLKALRSM